MTITVDLNNSVRKLPFFFVDSHRDEGRRKMTLPKI